MPQEPVLNLGYSTRVKVLLSGLTLVPWYILARFDFDMSPMTVMLILLSVAAIGLLANVVRSRVRIDASGVVKTALWGAHKFRRDEFLGHELVVDKPGKPPTLLLRFRKGIVHIDCHQAGIVPEAVLDFLKAEWGLSDTNFVAAAVGAVAPVQVFEYETVHLWVILALASSLIVLSFVLPMLALAGVIGALCLVTLWRAAGSIRTDAEGITMTHRVTGAVRIEWKEVGSVGYWNSLMQGGVRIQGGGKTIRAYRWIGGYPLLNRLLHDSLPATAFPQNLRLPMVVRMNYRRTAAIVLPYAVFMANALPMLWNGNYILFLTVASIPTLASAFLVMSSSRSLEFDHDEIRDISRVLWVKKVNRFCRTDLEDARLGRQLSVGGLWLKFRNCRVEVPNSDASLPPEEVLACLRKEWAWEQRISEPTDLRGAA